MEPIVTHKKLEPGVFQGRPDLAEAEKVAPPRFIRTMKSDMADAVKDQNESVVSIAIAEEKKKALARANASTVESEKPSAHAPKPISRIVVLIIALLIISLLGSAYVFILPKLGGIKFPSVSIPSFSSLSKQSSTSTTETAVEVASLAQSLVPAQHEKQFNITEQTKEQISDEVFSEMKLGLAYGSIKNLYLKEGENAPVAISANRLFIFTEVALPEIMFRSLEKEFMTGLFGEEDWGATPFLILKVSSYETGFAGMLEWESSLLRSYNTIFGINIADKATLNASFNDIMIGGKDARLVETPLGQTVAYAFANPNTVVIAGSTTALEAVLPIASKN
ncbi:MAG TPA: hypothetical protein DCS23_00170 [Candidatus Yonathbacteria bacterium]|nr:hypothetical protein [Candidatus Yonathbacteria bacterium]